MKTLHAAVTTTVKFTKWIYDLAYSRALFLEARLTQGFVSRLPVSEHEPIVLLQLILRPELTVAVQPADRLHPTGSIAFSAQFTIDFILRFAVYFAFQVEEVKPIGKISLHLHIGSI